MYTYIMYDRIKTTRLHEKRKQRQTERERDSINKSQRRQQRPSFCRGI